MNKANLIKSIARRTGATECQSKKMLEAFIKTLEEELDEGNGIILQGIGTFSPWYQSKRLGRNPRTGTTCDSPHQRQVQTREIAVAVAEQEITQLTRA